MNHHLMANHLEVIQLKPKFRSIRCGRFTFLVLIRLFLLLIRKFQSNLLEIHSKCKWKMIRRAT